MAQHVLQNQDQAKIVYDLTLLGEEIVSQHQDMVESRAMDRAELVWNKQVRRIEAATRNRGTTGVEATTNENENNEQARDTRGERKRIHPTENANSLDLSLGKQYGWTRVKKVKVDEYRNRIEPESLEEEEPDDDEDDDDDCLE